MKTASAREKLLKALGNDAPVDLRKVVGLDPERAAYEYDATWKCERQSVTWRDCAYETEQDVDKRVQRRSSHTGAYSDMQNLERQAAAEAKDIEWCRSCKAKKWLADNPAKEAVA